MIDWNGRPLTERMARGVLRDIPGSRDYFLGDELRMHGDLVDSFHAYRKSKLTVSVRSAEDILDWLRSCEYKRDEDVFDKPEVWLHPEDFEKTRVGDCEDHALWAWVQLGNLGLDTRFLVGDWKDGRHAWVTVRINRDWHVLETTSKDPRNRPLPASGVRDYLPYWSVDARVAFHLHRVGR